MKLIAGLVLLGLGGAVQDPPGIDWKTLETLPRNLKGLDVSGPQAILGCDDWGFLLLKEEYRDVRVEATLTIEEPARHTRFFGQSWSVWPRPDFPDQGFEAGLLLRAGPGAGYRVQLSRALQEVALVKVPSGGYLRSVPCEIKLHEPLQVTVEAAGSRIRVLVDGQEKISCRDPLLPLGAGRIGIGASSGARVSFQSLSARPARVEAEPPIPAHVPRFSARPWLGRRPWVFDGDEPILMLPSAQESYINNVKLRPGLKPLLSFNSVWDIANQGAFPDGASKFGEITVEGGGESLSATWTARNLKERFVQRSKMVVGWDPARSTYTYTVLGELEVLPGEPFHFRYGYDFEHHTPLDPFNWQYLIVRREGGQINRRPVYPVDPGVMDKIEQKGGARVWYGRHNEEPIVVPAVEYDLPEPGRRTLSSAVCAAFYDTGVAYASETAPAGTKVAVKYRYTGWPAREAEALFRASTVYETPMLDPQRVYIFADEWPKLTFSQFVPMSETWIYGRRPFMSGHNQRPTYDLDRNAGAGSGFAIRLGPGAYGAADLAAPQPVPEGPYALTALCRSVNAVGPGGRIEWTAKDKGGKTLRQATHFVGAGSWDWKKIGVQLPAPAGTATLRVGFGNGGTGEVSFTDVEFARPGPEGSPLPPPNETPPASGPAPSGALLDYRLVEQRGHFAYDFAQGPFGMLELANVDWTVDEGRPALGFADPAPGRRDVTRLGPIDLHYLKSIQWSGTPVAIAGFHGGGTGLKGLTLSTWIKPARTMGRGQHGGSGDIAGLGARRFILRLIGSQAPYALEAAVSVNDRFRSPQARVEADRWSHVAMTAEPVEGNCLRMRLYLNGRAVAEGTTEKARASDDFPPSFILGSELFYLHDSWYRGLIGRTIVLGRVAGADEIADLGR